MAGVQTIKKLITDLLSILDIAERVGDGAWTMSGNTLTIHNDELAGRLREVLTGANQAKLTEEALDLRPWEVLDIARDAIDGLKKVLSKHQ